MRISLSLPVLLLVASCVAAPPPPPPPARQVTPPPVAALPSPAPLASDWRDWPQTPGDWRYGRNQLASSAVFGNGPRGAFRIECNNDRRIRFYAPLGVSALTVRTTNVTRVLPTADVGHPPDESAAVLGPTDPLLDAIAFSRGRFVVEQPGHAPLVLPAWAEVERVIEDCRA